MTSEEIRNTFGWNAVASVGRSGYAGPDQDELVRLMIMAMGELAAQLADSSSARSDTDGK